MEFIENVDIDKLNFLKSLSKKQLLKYVDLAKKKDKENEYKKIIHYIDRLTKGNGSFKNFYKYTQNNQYGRLYSGTSIQGIPSNIRNFLFNGNSDYDMVNAHPTIMLYLCKKHNICCENLEYYVNNRDQVLDIYGADAKFLICKSICDEKPNRKLKVDYLKMLDKEIKKIQKAFVKIEDYAYIKEDVPSNRLYNFNGSFTSRLMCKYENEILQDMLHIANKNNKNILAPMFDGVILEGESDMCSEMEEYINNKWEGLNIKIKIKEMETTIDYTAPPKKTKEEIEEEKEIEEEEREIAKKVEEYCLNNTYDKVKERFEQEHFLLQKQAVFAWIREDEIITQTKTQLNTAFMFMKFSFITDGKWRQASFIPRWTNDQEIRKYETMDIYPPPLKAPKNVYNLWSDFEFNKSKYDNYTHKQEELEFILNHIKILCNHEQEVYDYLILWVAQMIQQPAIKPGILPIFNSLEGSGKGTFLLLLERMIGEDKMLETTDMKRDVLGVFNYQMVNSFLIYLNETEKKDNCDNEGKIKGLITDKNLTINQKGRDIIKIRSFHRFFSTTNKDEPFNTSKDDRRKFFVKASDEKKGDFEYFNKIHKMIEDNNVVKTCMEYFKSISDVDKFRSLKIPKTEYANSLKEMSKDVFDYFIEHIIEQHLEQDFCKISSKDLFEDFKMFNNKNKFNYDCNKGRFDSRLSRKVPSLIKTGRTKTQRYKIFNITKLKEHYGYNDLPDDEDSDFNEYSDEECEVEEKKQEPKHSLETKQEPKQFTIKVGNKQQQLSFMDDYANDYDPYGVY